MDLENLKKLRDATGIGILDCQKALKDAEGDYDKAIKLLREKGQAIASKKSDRATSEGLIGYLVKDKEIVVLELSCETDFVARGDKFQGLILDLFNEALAFKDNDIEKFLGFNDVQDKISQQKAALGENIVIKKLFYQKTKGDIVTYLHNSTASNANIGKILAIVFCNNKNQKNIEALNKVAMHIAAMKPLYLHRDQVPADKVTEEKEIYNTQLKDSGKPANIIEKIVNGKVEKFYQETVLLEQELAFDPQTKIKDFLSENDKDLQLESFQYFKVGV